MAAGGDPDSWMEDWATVLRTELAGLATDREALETFQAMGQVLAAMWARGPGGPDLGGLGLVQGWGGHDPAWPAAAAAAPVAGGDAWAAREAALLERIDALERRVAELERGRRRRGGAG